MNDNLVQVKVSDSWIKQVNEAVRKSGFTRSQFIRIIVLAEAKSLLEGEESKALQDYKLNN